MDNQPVATKGSIIKNIYLYLVSFVALMMVIFSAADLINTALRTYIFTKADNNYYGYPAPACPAGVTSTPYDVKMGTACQSKEEMDKQNRENATAQRQRDLVRDLGMIIVAIPVFAYHWYIIRKKERV